MGTVFQFVLANYNRRSVKCQESVSVDPLYPVADRG